MRILISGLLVLSLLTGCSKDGKSAKTVQFDRNRYETYRSGDVLLQVGDKKLTKGELELLARIKGKTVLAEVERSRVTTGKKPWKNKKPRINHQAFVASLLTQMPTAFRSEVAFLRWAETNQVALTDADIIEQRGIFLKQNKTATTDYATFVKKLFNAQEREMLERRLRVEAMGRKARKIYLEKHPIVISSNDVAVTIARLKTYNENAALTNAAVWARATNFWIQAKGSADFAALAEANTEDEASAEQGEWMDFGLADLEAYGLEKVVPNMAVGEVTAPIESDNGLNVIKLEAIEYAPAKSPGEGKQKRYILKRIFLRLPQFYEIPDFAEAGKQMKALAEDETMRAFVRKLMKNERLIYPHGEMIFKTAQEQARMPTMMLEE